MQFVNKFFAIVIMSATVLLAGPAHAADTPPAVQAFLDSMERQTSVKPSYDAITADGSGNATITNLTMAKPAAGQFPGMTMKMGKVSFAGIRELGPSLYEVEKAVISNMSFETAGQGGFASSIPELTAEGWYLQALTGNPTPAEQLRAKLLFARKMSFGKSSIAVAGHTVTVDGGETTWNGDPNTGAGTSIMKVSNIAIPDSMVARIDQGGMLKQLGYTSLNFDIAYNSDTKVSGDKMSHDFNVSFNGRSIATLSVGAALADISLAVYAQLMTLQMDTDEQAIAALAPQLQQVLFNGASLRFEDQSLVNRLLPMAAAMNGTDDKTLRASIGPMVQLALVQLQNEAFTQQAMAAVNAFFADPKSITLTANPASPLTMAEISAMDPNKPGETITRLGLQVTAND